MAYDDWKCEEPAQEGDYCEDEGEYCFECNNLGVIPCECGGDICVCTNNGEMPCPYCDR